MTTAINSHGGHAYAPGFEPGAWDTFVAYFSGSDLPIEPLAALICGLALAAVFATRVREKSRKRRRKVSLFPSGSSGRKGGAPVTLRAKQRKRSLEERRAVYDDWVA